MPGDPIEAMEFAQSKGKARKEGQTSVNFADVAGIDPIVAELQGIVTVSPLLSVFEKALCTAWLYRHVMLILCFIACHPMLFQL